MPGVEANLDSVITTLASYYHPLLCLPSLDPDPDTNGKPSDHRIVLVRPINVTDNKNARITVDIKVRPLTEDGMITMRTWLIDQDWSNIFEAESASDKAKVLQSMLFQKFTGSFPTKNMQN